MYPANRIKKVEETPLAFNDVTCFEDSILIIGIIMLATAFLIGVAVGALIL